MMTGKSHTPEEWAKIPWLSDVPTHRPRIHITQGYHATPSDIESATQKLAKRYYRELKLQI